MGVRGFRDALRSIVPRWMSNRPGFNAGFKVMYAGAALLDCMVEASIEGINAWMPGRGTPTALPLIGRSRGIMRGEADTDASYATKLIAWLDDWINAGADEILAAEIQGYLGNTPTVRIVERAGFWVSIDPSGNITTTNASWNWDGVSNPGRAGQWSDLWIIVYADEWTRYSTFLDPAWDAAWGGAPGFGTGHEVGRTAVDAINALVQQWKGAHTWIVAIVFTNDSATMKPGGINPDGNWGEWGKVVSGLMQPARVLASPHQDAVRCWVPSQG